MLLKATFLSFILNYRKILFILTAGILTVSCSNRQLPPAPVKELYQGKTYKDYQQQAYTGGLYTVNKGDTLFSIAWYSGKEYLDLARLNGIKKPYQIYPGQILKLSKSKIPPAVRPISHSGHTYNKGVKQAVDLPKKQAYGKRKENVRKDRNPSSFGTFPVQVASWLWPTSTPISESFSTEEEGNKGLDFIGKLGTPIFAAADGKIVYTGDALRGFGRLIIIKHSEAFLSAYAHNDKILVKEQQWVKKGQKIAQMGSSGADKVKLHFEVRYKGKSINPLNYLPKR